jgi:hypothetical protein
MHWPSCRVYIILPSFNEILRYLNRFSKKSRISNFVKIRPVEAELLLADRQTGMAKLIVDFRKFSNAPTSTNRFKANNCFLLRCYAESSGNFLPPSRSNLSVPSSRFKNGDNHYLLRNWQVCSVLYIICQLAFSGYPDWLFPCFSSVVRQMPG